MTVPYLAEFEEVFERSARIAENNNLSVTDVLDRFLLFVRLSEPTHDPLDEDDLIETAAFTD